MSNGNDVCCMLEILESSTNSDADPKKKLYPQNCVKSSKINREINISREEICLIQLFEFLYFMSSIDHEFTRAEQISSQYDTAAH